MSTYPERGGSPSGSSGFPAALLLLVLLVLVCGGLLAYVSRSLWWPQSPEAPVPARVVTPAGNLADMEKQNIEVYEKVSPSVVHVTNLAERSNPFSLNVQRIPRGSGTGFVWDEDGHVVTNYHVVKGANALQVTLADHSTYDVDGDKSWAYAEKDIAVLTVNAPKSKLKPIPLVGSSHDLKVGQITFAIGNPFGLDLSMTTGIVSALGREIEEEDNRPPIQGAIQTSAAINPGNSGGPLLDSSGRLIGVTTAIISPSGASAGIGFAIPVDDVNQIVTQLINHAGKAAPPRLGVQIAEDQQRRQLGVDDGALLLKVVPNSPAEKAGLRGTTPDRRGRFTLGDVIVAINGQAVHNGRDLLQALNKAAGGDTITLTILRDGERQDVKVELTPAQQ
jgi:S1-C subfamily serine protease